MRSLLLQPPWERVGDPHCLEESLQKSVDIVGGELGPANAGNGPCGGLGVSQGAPLTRPVCSPQSVAASSPSWWG